MSSTISREVTAGTLSSTDATALTTALNSIDTSLSSNSTATSSNSSSKLDPSSMKDRIDSLISDQVSSGTLTSDQATELKNLFSSHGKSTEGSDASGGVSGMDGPPSEPPPGPPPGDAASDSDSSSASTATGNTSTISSASSLLATFMQQLQSSQSNTARYWSNGASDSNFSASALLLDFRA